MSSFIMQLADIKAWLEGTEQKLAIEMSEDERNTLLQVGISLTPFQDSSCFLGQILQSMASSHNIKCLH